MNAYRLAELVLWFGLFAALYTYALYPMVLLALASFRRPARPQASASNGAQMPASQQWPTVAVLVAAYNEERHIAARIANLLASDYPAHALHIYVGSDCSADGTNAIAQALAGPQVHFTAFAQRRGKPSVINDLAAMATQDVLVFTDANTEFEPGTIKALVRPLADPAVGCVSGELRLHAAGNSDNQDHVYWRYERTLKFYENQLGALLGANGGVYALRRQQYQPIAPDTIVDDFSIAAGLMLQGLRCQYEPLARAYEETPPRLADEFPRRVRIGMGNYQVLSRYPGLMNPAHGYVALAFISHKLVRWFVPHCLVAALLCSLLLAPSSTFYASMAAAQLLFYLGAAWGWAAGRQGAVPRLARIPVFFVSMNLALLLGHLRYLRGGYSGAWARSAR